MPYVRPVALSPRGVRRIGGEEWTGKEGLRPNGRYYPYRDYVQRVKLDGWTIGIGHLVGSNEDFSNGLTLAEVVDLFNHDQRDVYAAINRHVSLMRPILESERDFYGYAPDEPLPAARWINQSEWDSLADAGHNLGWGWFEPKGHHPIAALNLGDLVGFADPACDGHCATNGKPAHLQDYNRSGNGFDPGLLARRRREREWFFEPLPPMGLEHLFTEDEKREILALVGRNLWEETGELLDEERRDDLERRNREAGF